MSANSFIELYTTVFGWILYDGIWNILNDTGLTYLPFVGALARNFTEPYESQNERDASITSIKRMEIEVFTMLTVIVLAGQPFLGISVTESTYSLSCGAAPVSGNNTKTTYDNAFSSTSLGGQSAEVPIWWFGVMRLSGGVTNAALQAIPCGTDLRQLRYELNNETFTDAETLRQVRLFHNDCWAPSRALFDNSGESLPEGMDPNDINWAGSVYFQGAGYYDRRQASRSIPGFAFQATPTSGGSAQGRDSAYWNTNRPKPQWGHPLCSEWWSDPTNGLRTRMLREIDPVVLAEFKAVVADTSAVGTPEEIIEEGVIRKVLGRGEDTRIQYTEGPDYPGPTGLVAAVGAKLEQFTLYPKIYLLKQAAPIVQALILMLLYAVLPFILVFSSYSIATVITTSIILFAIKFLTVLWIVAVWFDTHLQEALLIGAGRADSWTRTRDFFLRDGIDTLGEDVLQLTLAILFVVAPLVWVYALGLAGLTVGKAIGDLVGDASKPSGSAGEKGGEVAKSAVKSAVGFGIGKLDKK